MTIKPPQLHCALIALQTANRELSPAAKYLFVRAVFLLGAEKSEDTRDQLVDRIGMPLNALIPAHEELMEAGLAHGARGPSYSRKGPVMTTQGRFRQGFALAPEVVANIETEATWMGAARQCRVREMLETLVLWPESGPCPQIHLPEEMRLGYANRLLMGVLLAFADDFGIVRDVSSGRLVELTGMTPGQVGSQLRKLARAGFIRYRIPGVNGKVLFPKAPGAVVLNLGDRLVPRAPTWLPVPRLALTDHFQALDPLIRFLRRRRIGRGPARDLFPSDCNRFLDQVVSHHDDWPLNSWREEHERAVGRALARSADYLHRDPRHEVIAYTQYKLCIYASEILSRSGYPAASRLDPRDAIITRARAELLSPRLAEKPAPSVLAAIFYYFAERLASEVLEDKYEKYESAPESLATGGRWAVIPPPNGGDQLMLLFLPQHRG